jgi:hypothetical protein
VFAAFASGNPEEFSYGQAGPPILVYAEGWVTVNGEEAAVGQKIAPGSVVQAASDSMCEITVGSNVLRIYENTVAVVRIDAAQSRLELKTGALAAVLDKVETINSGGSLSVDTPTAVAGVRGTVFYIKVEDLSNTYICTCNGTLYLTEGQDGPETPNTGIHHSAYRFTRSSSGGISKSQAEMLYHTDDEMEEIADRINSSIDWSTAD